MVLNHLANISMKIINKFRVVIFFLSALLICNTSYSQDLISGAAKDFAKQDIKEGAKVAARNVAKQAAKNGVKTSAKVGAKAVAKSEAKAAVRAETKGVVKNTIKSEVKASAKSAIKADTKRAIEKGTAKTYKEATEKVLKSQASKAAQKSLVTVEKTAVNVTEKGAKKGVAKQTVKSTTNAAKIEAKETATRSAVKMSEPNALVKKLSVSDSKALVKNSFNKEVKVLSSMGDKRVASKVAEHRVKKSLGNAVVEKTIENTISKEAVTKTVLESRLGKNIAERSMAIGEGRKGFAETLLKDLDSHPLLEKEIKKNPDILKAYERNFNSPQYRSDISVLRYQSYRGNFYSEHLAFRDKSKSLVRFSGEDQLIVEKNGTNLIIDKNTGAELGKLSGGPGNYIIECFNGDGNALQNMSLMPNTQYITKTENAVITTNVNKNGQRSLITVKADGQKPYTVGKRNNDKIQKASAINKEMTLQGLMDNRNHNIKADGGHIVPKSCGGSDDMLNLFAQNPDLNRYNSKWRGAENAYEKALKNKQKVQYEIEFLSYEKNSFWPTKIRQTLYVDGKKVADNVFDNLRVLAK